MKLTLTTSHATGLLKADSNAGWSRSGARALVEHLEQLEEDCGTELEFDAVAIRCDYSEHENALEAAKEYGFEPEEEEDEYATEASALDWLSDRTEVITFPEGIIIRNF
jgi:hypothetical protein